MSEEQAGDQGLRDRLSSAGEDAVGERSAMTALNIPSGSELERLERRVRSVSDRMEALEDRLDDIALDVGVLRKKLEGLAAQDQGRAETRDPGERS